MLNSYRTMLNAAGRLLGLMDRCEQSATYGCMDRAYWHYKTLTDFAGATWQQPAYGFAMLYNHNHPDNPFYLNPSIKRWTEAALLWWAGIQNRDGSFNEWYANEHSYCATAFTTWAVSRAVMEMDKELSPEATQTVRQALIKSGIWLCLHSNQLVGNQMAAALAALLNLYSLTHMDTFYQGAQAKKEWILNNQNDEGWLPEYGGADAGYAFVALEMLVEAARIAEDEEIRSAAGKMLEWLAPLVHPDGSVGGAQGRRGGQMFMPGGLSLFGDDPRARYIQRLWMDGIDSGRFMDILKSDDRYLAYFYFNSFVRAVIDHPHDLGMNAPGYQPPAFIHYPEAGLIIINSDGFYVLIGSKMGGSLKVYHGRQMMYQDAGYIIEDDQGRTYTSQGPGTLVDSSLQGLFPGDLKVTISAVFRRWNRNKLKNNLFIPFKLVTRTLFLIAPLAQHFGRRLKKSMIMKIHPTRMALNRQFTLSTENLEIIDNLVNLTGRKVSRVRLESSSTLVHSPSTRIFSDDVLLSPRQESCSTEICSRINSFGRVTIKLVIPLPGWGKIQGWKILDKK